MALLVSRGARVGADAASAKEAPTRAASAKAALASDDGWRGLLADKVIVGMCDRAVSIGRSSASMVQIGSAATTISRKHAEIARTSRGRYELCVFGMNGVRVNGTLHGCGASVELQGEDELNFVGIRYRFRAPSAAVSADAAADDEAEDWWPEPVRKHAADADDGLGGPQHKRARILASSGSELYQNSTDTLVGCSETGLFCADGKQPELAQQLLLLDGLPPSSPPPVHALSDMFGSESDGECADDLPDTVDIESVTPMRPLVASPLPLPSTPQPATPELAAGVLEADAMCAKAANALAATKLAPAGGLSQAKENAAVDKENAVPPPSPPFTAAKAAKATGAPKQRKPRKSAGEHTKQVRAARDTAAGGRAEKPDDEMMASLRELLGIVDPSEGLADSIDSETEVFLTTRPEEPIELAAGASLIDVVIETMVFSARTSHTISDLLRDIAQVDGHEGRARNWRHHLAWTLFHSKCFGRVERRVKDASDRRAEDRWYYDAAEDDCVERRENFGGLVRTARRCTLRDTQYYFKQVPKLPSFRYK
ncbi:hypothetical protein LPJ61_001231 [Coemansia biformis]|uniref:FHA domain-containing protein n=1 Tax=Coemansia biformis TaxID=1286918 RepID=A0A9W7YEQ6_9FUNG|nr:hypothetical protein LPJ61_001231 [Coemansia biformis]